MFTKPPITLLILVLSLTLACSTTTTTTVQPTVTQPSLTASTAVTEPAPVTTVKRDIVYGSGPFILSHARIALADLSSYTATLTLSFDGTRDGTPEKWTTTYVMLASKEPAISQLTIETVGEISNPSPELHAKMDGMDYEKIGNGPCSAVATKEGASLHDRSEPASFLSFVVGADAAGTETINDVASNHYTFDQHALGLDGLAESAGELWVASEGGYIVKYVLTSKANPDYFGEGIEGTLSYDYELTDINSPVTIKLPQDCPPGFVDTPLLPDASNVAKSPGLLTYETSSSLNDAAAFYQEQIPQLGWTLQGEPAITEVDVLLVYTMDTETMTVIISTMETHTEVQILLSKTPAATP